MKTTPAIFLSLFLMVKTPYAQKCDFLFDFSNLSEFRMPCSTNELVFKNEKSYSNDYSFYNFYDYEQHQYYNLIVKDDSIVSGNFSLLIYEMKYDSAHAHLARDKHDKYSLSSDNSILFNEPFTKSDLRKLNENINLAVVTETFIESVKTSPTANIDTFNIDGVAVFTGLKCGCIVEYSSNCHDIKLGISSHASIDSTLKYLMNEIDHSISFKKKENHIIKSLPFKYYSFDGAYYSWKKGPLGKLKYGIIGIFKPPAQI